MNRYLPFALLSLVATPLPAIGDAGKTLVDANCTSCHGNEVYTRADRKVRSLDGLKKQVQRCELALGLRWFDDQVADTTAYLNQSFYHFK